MKSTIPPILLEQLQKLEPAEFTGTPPHVVSSTGNHYFAKNSTAGEAESLKQIAIAAPGLAPRVLAAGSDGRPYMITEYKNLSSLSDGAASRLGERLATELHRYKSSKGFGFGNGWFESWDKCFSAMIGDLLSQLVEKGGFTSLCAKGEDVRVSVIPKLLVVQPVLLHGDLWSGNTGVEAGEPVIFDPASYYGHNEADLAIGRIFGGIPKIFFETYHRHLPRTEPVGQYNLRGDLYQLFHYLNHTLLFGVCSAPSDSNSGHYASTAERKMDILLAAKF
ncbi:fructosamine kinase PKL/CAK/FruK [Mycena alexandri]|uniref:protein-ribulosamine 3-kinase n=1 Tax=Mycena alexandri TaxID=1745969 RepID=A0AAD6X8D1_9AGAR|nr:fructosamine kinase PKL/CAK/FruK [Mycena alexandri]